MSSGPVRRKFRNLYPHARHGLSDVLRWKLLGGAVVVPPYTPPITRPNGHLSSENSATWIGHSSFFLRLGGQSLLVDPVFSDYCAPFPIRRLKRRAPPGLSLNEVGTPAIVLLTHNHYDHLDRPTIQALPRETLYLVPLGLASWFRSNGRSNVVEFAWWETRSVGGARVTCVPAQHFSSRTLWDRDRTLWCGWVLQSRDKTIYLAGDTGYAPSFTEIGARLGPMDFSAIPIGAYEPRWFMQPMHVAPEESVRIHQDVRSKLSAACHWGTFCLTDEPMDEPPARLAQALRDASIDPTAFRVLSIGETIEF